MPITNKTYTVPNEIQQGNTKLRADKIAENFSDNSTIVNTVVIPTDTTVESLGTAAYTNSTAYATAGHALSLTNSGSGNAVTAISVSGHGITATKGSTFSYIPPGSVFAFAGNSTPSGFILCNGGAVSRTTYSALFSAIGTTYGTGDGSTTFNVPNYNNKFIEGNGTAGTSVAAGLPNITGQLYRARRYLWESENGCFKLTTESVALNSVTVSGDGHKTAYTTNFNASYSNSIYGKSSTVQPSSLTARYIIKY